MKTKRILSMILVLSMLLILPSQNTLSASAATTKIVYQYAPMLVENGYIYYIQRIDGDQHTYQLYRIEIATGNKTSLLSSKEDILDMMLHNDTLYYTSYIGEKDIYQTFSISVDTKEKKTVCDGKFVSLDDRGIYYIVPQGEVSKLYKQAYDSANATLLYTGNMTFGFVKNLDSTLYFSQFNEKSSKLTLFKLMPEKTKLTVLTSDKIVLNGGDRDLLVSDLTIINGAIYYQYGTHQGSGNYWYGTLMRFTPDTKKKSLITDQSYEEQIHHNSSSIFYNGLESSDKHYKYNTKTGKTSTYTYKITGTESFNVLGNYTYSAKADGKELITVSRFTTGTNQKNLVKSFINISHKQNKKYDYSASVRQEGDYLLIPVTAMDFNDNTYGWRGKCVGITWFVADTDGKILTQFR